MECNEVQKNIVGLIKGTLKGNVLRRTYYHIKKCEICSDILLDEFSFYTAFNDKDLDLDYNYKKKIEELLNDIGKEIIKKDNRTRLIYTICSIIICLLGAFMISIALSVVY